MKMFYEKDTDVGLIKNKKIAIFYKFKEDHVLLDENESGEQTDFYKVGKDYYIAGFDIAPISIEMVDSKGMSMFDLRKDLESKGIKDNYRYTKVNIAGNSPISAEVASGFITYAIAGDKLYRFVMPLGIYYSREVQEIFPLYDRMINTFTPKQE